MYITPVTIHTRLHLFCLALGRKNDNEGVVLRLMFHPRNNMAVQSNRGAWGSKRERLCMSRDSLRRSELFDWTTLGHKGSR